MAFVSGDILALGSSVSSLDSCTYDKGNKHEGYDCLIFGSSISFFFSKEVVETLESPFGWNTDCMNQMYLALTLTQ